MSDPSTPKRNAGLPVLNSTPPAKDPVCGMSVIPERAAARFEHEGRTYFFCSAGCGEKFRKEPARYLVVAGTAGMSRGGPAGIAGAAPAAAKPSGAAREYTCPMHPEVVRNGPGACPICGMALEPREVTAEEQADPELEMMSRRFWVSAALTAPILFLAMSEECRKENLRVPPRFRTWPGIKSARSVRRFYS